MHFSAVFALVRRDLKIVSQSRGVLLPMLVVPVLSLVLLPVLAVVAPSLGDSEQATVLALSRIVDWMSVGLQDQLAGYTDLQKWVVLVLVYFLAPLYLIVPLMVASVVAADSFAGEKERKTLEALLYTPTTDAELFFGKVLAAWLPAMAVSLGSFLLYATVANWVAWPVLNRLLFPNAIWLILVFWVAPAVAAMGLSVTVLISSRVQSFQEAFQLGGFVVLPIVVLLVGQVSGVMYFSKGMVALLGLGFWLIDAALLVIGARIFRRENLLTGDPG
ncbi:MAG: ABC transporter permease subunit [Rhodothermales bacterium]|nr:ABC transporter permease subunit [Rhodothermales bacterium]